VVETANTEVQVGRKQ